jgi:predicted nucleotidyltransferase
VTSLARTLHDISTDLTEARASFALIGGLAVSVRTEPRFTRDADLAVAVADDAEAESLIANLRAIGYRIGTALERKAVGRLATVRLDSPAQPGPGPVVDLLFASSGIEAEIVRDAEALEVLPSLVLPVARTGHLIALKLLSRNDADRPQDAIDLRALVDGATADEVARARDGVRLITARGYQRGRLLERSLDEALIQFGGGAV